AFTRYKREIEQILPLERRYLLSAGDGSQSVAVWDRLKWAFQDKKKIFRLVETFAFWNVKVKQVMDLSLGSALKKEIAEFQGSPFKQLGLTDTAIAWQIVESGAYDHEAVQISISGLNDQGNPRYIH